MFRVYVVDLTPERLKEVLILICMRFAMARSSASPASGSQLWPRLTCSSRSR